MAKKRVPHMIRCRFDLLSGPLKVALDHMEALRKRNTPKNDLNGVVWYPDTGSMAPSLFSTCLIWAVLYAQCPVQVATHELDAAYKAFQEGHLSADSRNLIVWDTRGQGTAIIRGGHTKLQY